MRPTTLNTTLAALQQELTQLLEARELLGRRFARLPDLRTLGCFHWPERVASIGIGVVSESVDIRTTWARAWSADQPAARRARTPAGFAAEYYLLGTVLSCWPGQVGGLDMPHVPELDLARTNADPVKHILRATVLQCRLIQQAIFQYNQEQASAPG